MPTQTIYTVTHQQGGAFHLERTAEPFPGVVAHITPALTQTGEQRGWRLKPLVTIQGATSRLWPTAADAIAATKLMTIAQAQRAVNNAISSTTGQTAARVQ
jgi:hypothetical protein